MDDSQGGASGTMVVRAHGLPRARLHAAHDAGLTIVDATCPIVHQAQEAARELEARGCQVILIGDRNHAEIQGVLGALERPARVLTLGCGGKER